MLKSHLSRTVQGLTLVVTALLLSFNSAAQSSLAPNAKPGSDAGLALMLYQGSDRDARLLDQAKKEGTVTIYTSQNPKDLGTIVEAFQKRYGIKVTVWRSSGEKVTQRSITEARAGRFTPDLFESDSVVMETLARENLMQPFFSPHFKDYPPTAFVPSKLYVAERFNMFTIAYNTQLVKPEDVPQTYQDLLLPKWRGKLGLEIDDSDWFAAMVRYMGEEKGLKFFQQLAAQKPLMRKGHTLTAELVAAGEIPIAVSLYNHAVERLAKNGAPIQWKALSPTMARAGGIGISKRPPHPHAALLFADFILSEDGQSLLKKRHRVPASKLVSSKLNQFPYDMIDPALTLDEGHKWEKLWTQLFIGPGKTH
jgi:iron(III) transport system substrate-binding protein